MTVCNPAASGVVNREMEKAVTLRKLLEAREKSPSLLKQLGAAQLLAQGFIQIDNLATTFKELQPFVDGLHLGEKMRAIMAHEYNPVMREVGNLSTADSGKIMRIVEAGNAGETITQNADGSASVTPKKDLVGLKAGESYTLPPKLNAVLNNARKTLDGIYDNVIRATTSSMGYPPDTPTSKMSEEDAEVIDLLKESRRDNYFPQVRRGRYAVQFFRTVDGEKVRHLESFDASLEKGIKTSQARARQRAAELQKEGAEEVTIRDLQQEQDLFDLYTPSTDSLTSIDALFQSIMLPNQKDAYQATRKVIDRLKSERAGRKQRRLMRRRDVPGWLREDNYDTYFRSTFPSYVFSMSDYIANKATEGVRREAINKIGDPQLNRIATEAEEYLHSDESAVARLKNFTFLYTIGGNLSSALVQPTQLLHTTWPLLSGLAGTGRAAAAIMKATKDAMSLFSFKVGAENVFNVDKSNLSAEEKQLVKEMFRSGVAEALLTRDQAPAWLARSQDPAMYSLGQATGKVMEVMSLAFSSAETLNRVATGLAAYRLTKDTKTMGRLKTFAANTGAEINTPFDAVEWAVRETQFTMGKPFRAKYMRGMVGGTLLQFMPFTFKMLGFQRRAAEYYGGKGIFATDPGKKVFALHLLGLFATAGLWGLPFAAPLGDILDKLLKEVGPEVGLTPVALKAELREAMQGIFKEIPGLNEIATPAELADYFFNGPFRATGIDISKRTALDVIPENVLSLDLLDIGPFLSAVVGGAADAYTYQKKGLEWMAIASLLPVFARNAARAYTMQSEGFVTPGKVEPTLPAREMRDPFDVVAVGIGFTPTKVAEAREALRETKDLGTKMDSVRRSYSERIARLLARYAETNDPALRQEAIALRNEISQHDKDKPLRDRIIQDPTSFNSGINEKVKAILYPQRPDVVPKSVRPEYMERIQK